MNERIAPSSMIRVKAQAKREASCGEELRGGLGAAPRTAPAGVRRCVPVRETCYRRPARRLTAFFATRRLTAFLATALFTKRRFTAFFATRRFTAFLATAFFTKRRFKAFFATRRLSAFFATAFFTTRRLMALFTRAFFTRRRFTACPTILRRIASSSSP